MTVLNISQELQLSMEDDSFIDDLMGNTPKSNKKKTKKYLLNEILCKKVDVTTQITKEQFKPGRGQKTVTEKYKKIKSKFKIYLIILLKNYAFS